MSNPKEAIAKLGLHIQSEFVPFSQSRNAKEELPSLNWKVTLSTLSPLDGQRRNILTTDYGAGCAHAPSYKTVRGDKTVRGGHAERDLRVAYECEHGFPVLRVVDYQGGLRVVPAVGENNRIEPKAEDVLHSLVSDSDVLDAGGFESWARDLGYDTDSRKAEAIYRACLEIALKLRGAIGESGLSELREAFQDY